MQLLSLDLTYRRWLYSRFALGFDCNLDEIFVGLTRSESVFFAEITGRSAIAYEAIGADGITRFLEMHERHEIVLSFKSEKLRYLANHSSPPHGTPSAHRL